MPGGFHESATRAKTRGGEAAPNATTAGRVLNSPLPVPIIHTGQAVTALQARALANEPPLFSLLVDLHAEDEELARGERR